MAHEWTSGRSGPRDTRQGAGGSMAMAPPGPSLWRGCTSQSGSLGGSVSEEARAIRGPGPAATSGTQLHQLAGRRWNKRVCSVSRLAKKLGRQAVFGDAGPKSRNSAQNHARCGRQGRFGGLCLQAARHDRPQPESAGAVWLFKACFRIPFAFPTVSERSDCGRRRCVSPTTNVEL